MATFPVPVKLALTTGLQDITSVTPVGKVRTYDVRYTNVGAADAYGDLVLTDGVTAIQRAKNYPVPFQTAASAPDMESQLIVPAGWKVQGKASASNVVEASVANMVETDVVDFV